MGAKLSIRGAFLWEGADRVQHAPLDDARLLLAVGLPNPALQALCKLITASETGEQLISRVSSAGSRARGLGRAGGQSSDPDRKLCPRDERQRRAPGQISQHGGAGR